MSTTNFPLITGVGEGGGADLTYTPNVPTTFDWGAIAPADLPAAIDLFRRINGKDYITTSLITLPGGPGAITNVFTIPVEANKKYSFEFALRLFSTGLSTVRVWPTYPTGCLETSAGFAGANSSGAFQDVVMDSGAFTLGTYTSPNNGHYGIMKFYLELDTGANAGNFVFRCQSGVAANVNVRIGSWARVREILG